jgi:preprotein translocase subunit SecE
MISRLVNYLKDSKAELKKVNWPTRKEATQHTIIVIILSLSVAAFLGVLDFAFAKGLTLLLK